MPIFCRNRSTGSENRAIILMTDSDSYISHLCNRKTNAQSNVYAIIVAVKVYDTASGSIDFAS